MGKIIAVDFDGTLCEDIYPEIGKPKEQIIRYVKWRKSEGDKLILWSCRNGDRLNEAIDWCKQYGIEFDAVNKNLPYIIEAFGGDTRKIYADNYLDDRSIITESIENYIFDIDGVWERVVCEKKIDDGRSADLYSCVRNSDLYKFVFEDGTLSYVNTARAVSVDINTGQYFRSSLAGRIVDKYYPITLPHNPNDRIMVMEELTFSNDSDDSIIYISHLVTPDGERIEVDEYFSKDSDLKVVEISKDEYNVLKQSYENNSRNDLKN